MRLSEVKQVPVDWVWEGRLARGMFTLLEGDPGVGKGLLSIDIAARLTRGWPLPGEEGYTVPIEQRVAVREPVGVMLIGTEDSVERTVLPRARVAGADLTRIISLRGITPSGRTFVQVTESLVSMIYDFGKGNGIRYIHLDPIEDVLPGFTSFDATAIRTAVSILNDFARRADVAYCGVRHLNKSGRGRAIARGRGSISLSAAARFVYLVGRDAADPDVRIMACVKNNLGDAPASLAFRIVGDVPRIEWIGPVDVCADQLLMPERGGVETAVGKAELFLLERLGGGPVPISLVMEEASQAGISSSSLWRAKTGMKLKSIRNGFGGGGYWLWALPRISATQAASSDESGGSKAAV